MAHTVELEKVESSTNLQHPKQYKVVLHNDNTTTFEFVIAILVNVFHRSMDDSIAITNSIHTQGFGIAGSPYSREIAEEKRAETVELSRRNNFPLAVSIEEL